MLLERGQHILIKPHRYVNGVEITQLIVDNVHDWGVRGYTYARIIGLDDLGDGLTRISIRVDWVHILQVLYEYKRPDYFYPDLPNRGDLEL
jgi:hypothetical protein